MSPTENDRLTDPSTITVAETDDAAMATSVPADPPARAGKNIVMCLDGTANQIVVGRNTNVVKLFRAIDFTEGRQLAYYDPGVGTFASTRVWSAPGRFASKMLGRAFGLGLKTNLAEAYTFLMNNWEPEDRIFIFGFSRGAFTARALAGLLHTVGIPRRSSENLIQYAIGNYAGRGKWTDKDQAEVEEFQRTVCRQPTQPDDKLVDSFSVPIAYMGLWDTVNAPGILRRSLSFANSDTLQNVRAGRHAVSIDERRRPYRERLVQTTAIQEAWFAGVHSDVGGGFTRDALGDISLLWILRGAHAAGIDLRAKAELRELPTRTQSTWAIAPVHRNSRVWVLATYRRRSARQACIHPSVAVRREHHPGYASHLGSTTVFDEDWLDDSWQR
ncbi:DUF2235 domain-containing protein [Gordonia soli]|uniref:T6SS Phospholipase effector Tle1-like catalytic domain-containing protein n=1 Tax=Gordonia soli NBRC 108243 TaxID=1223545 RepID=M0QPQ9_9ACTN|nr:DUF2235 domain-containing protein [Gordonia soli]GAC70256.1 hypothetical protein GS4_33_00710 [Gordonia soli NBRC 108243]